MIKLSRLTDYGMLILAQMAENPERLFTSTELAGDTRIAATTVSKLLKVLATNGILLSFRGKQGGYRLAKRPADIQLTSIIEAFEGPMAMTECAKANSHCGIEGHCTTKHHWQRINQVITEALSTLSLSDITAKTLNKRPMIHGELP